MATTRSARVVEVEPGQGQAALRALLRLVGEVQHRVDQVPDHVVDVVGEDPQRHPELRRGQPDAGCVEHRVGQVADQHPQLLVEVHDRGGRGAQHRVAEQSDGLDGHSDDSRVVGAKRADRSRGRPGAGLSRARPGR